MKIKLYIYKYKNEQPYNKNKLNKYEIKFFFFK